MEFVKIKAVFIALLMIATVFSIYVPAAKAETKACCELSRSGEGCVFTDVNNCDSSGRIAYTTCEQTNFCNLGCCYSSKDGSCNKNTPKAVCNSKQSATFIESPDCNIAACQKGCCLIGEEAFFVTQTQCKQYGSQFPDLKVNFDSAVSAEKDCLEKSRSEEIGCCVTDDSCMFTTRASCNSAPETLKSQQTQPAQSGSPQTPPITNQEPAPAPPTEAPPPAPTGQATADTSNDNQQAPAAAPAPESVKEVFIGNKGFYKNTLCSNDKLQCGCAKQHHTECYQGRVYWFDSCGNRENIYDANKAKAYNNGFILPISESCKADKYDAGCGNCEYSEGTLCGQAPVDVKPKFGALVCNDLNCYDTYDDKKISPNAGGDKKHGESWCVYDKYPGQGRDRPGSRHYRHLCIAGEEMTEPCADFRDQLCIQGILSKEVLETQKSFDLPIGQGYIEAACRKNRFENCDKFAKKSDCENIAFSDCYWMEAGIINTTKNIENIGISGEMETTPPGVCVPIVPPGLKFWPDTEVVNMGREVPAGQESAANQAPEIDAKETCGKATRECVVMFETAPLRGINDKCIRNCHCLKEDWIIAGYNLCSAQGDCGAKYNTLDKVSLSGLEVIDEKNHKKFTSDMLGRTAIAKAGKSPSEPGLFNKLDNNKGWAGLLGIAATGVISALGSEGDFFDVLGESTYSGPSWLLGGAQKFFGELFGSEKEKTESPVKQEKTKKNDDKNQVAPPPIEPATPRTEPAPVIETAAAIAIDQIIGNSVLDITGMTTNDEVKEKLETTQDEIKKAIEKAKDKLDAAKETAKDQGNLNRLKEMIGELEKLEPKTGESSEKLEKKLEELNSIKSEYNEMFPGFLSKVGSFFGSASTFINIAAWGYLLYSAADIMTTKYKTYKVSTVCNQWVAPLGGKDCEKCNNEFKPCSEYKCRSLGQTCRLVNPGTGKENCVNMHPNDVNSPIITPNKDALTKGFKIKDSGPNQGFEIVEKIEPFTPLSMGINTNEPASCKYSTNASMKFDEMPFVFGEPLFLYNQTMRISLPMELASEEALKQTHGIYTLFIKCMDASGNKNNKDYFIKMKIKPGRDLTPPIIEAASLKDNAYIASNIRQMDFSLFTNEPASCKYSSNDVAYENMQNEFECSKSGFQTASLFYSTYECSTTLKDLKQGINLFFFRCKDNSNNVNQESFKFSLIGTKPLLINQTAPEGDVMSNNITLAVVTVDGAQEGKAVCGYKLGSSPFIEFTATNSNYHTQNLDLATGSYNFKVTCEDTATNQANANIKFQVVKDLQAPKLIFVYKDKTASILHIELNEITTCEYSTIKPFQFGDGAKMTNENAKIHEAGLVEDSSKFYIVCQDVFKNSYNFVVYP